MFCFPPTDRSALKLMVFLLESVSIIQGLAPHAGSGAVVFVRIDQIRFLSFIVYLVFQYNTCIRCINVILILMQYNHVKNSTRTDIF